MVNDVRDCRHNRITGRRENPGRHAPVHAPPWAGCGRNLRNRRGNCASFPADYPGSGGRKTTHAPDLGRGKIHHRLQRRALQHGGDPKGAGRSRTYLPGLFRHGGGAARLRPVRGRVSFAVQWHFRLRHLGGKTEAAVFGKRSDWCQTSILYAPFRRSALRLRDENHSGIPIRSGKAGRTGGGAADSSGAGAAAGQRGIPGHGGNRARMLRILRRRQTEWEAVLETDRRRAPGEL